MLKELNNIYGLSQLVVLGIIFLTAFYFYFSKKDKLKFLINKLIVAALSFSALLAIVKTINQYYVWSGNELSQLLLPPHQSIDYFVFYAFGRFWLGVLIGVAVSFLFYLFLKFLEKRQNRFFIEGETALGFLTALIVGWPNFVIFLPLVFISTVLIAIYRRLILKEPYTTLGYPFLLAAGLVLIFGKAIIAVLNLGVLRI
ncbi:MAG: hypothetical protein DDT18_01531 [Actinobacteria bacterium]|nr:hypothetical protein [Actinomycetota bacterium]